MIVFNRHSYINGYLITLELAFATKSLRDICMCAKKAKKKLGEDNANMLIRRLADMRAADSPKELIVGHPREIDINNEKLFAVDLSENCTILLRANHRSTSLFRNGNIDWGKVRRIKILSIGVVNE